LPKNIIFYIIPKAIKKVNGVGVKIGLTKRKICKKEDRGNEKFFLVGRY